jgi:hypothetical protein
VRFLPGSLRRQKGYISPAVLSAIGCRRRSGTTGGGSSGPDTDPNFANVVALLHFDGADGATTFTDNSPGSPSRIWTPSGAAQIDTDQSKFGGASGLFDGTTDYLTTSDDADLELGSGDFTIEGWIRPNSVTGQHNFLAKYSGTGFGAFGIDTETTTAKFYAGSTGTSWDITTNSGKSFGTVATGTWYHFAITRSGSDWFAFLDGVEGATWSSAAAILATNTPVTIGANADGTVGFNGWIDEIRITKGVARYTSNFTPPSAAFPDS